MNTSGLSGRPSECHPDRGFMDHMRPSSAQSVGSGSTGQSSLMSCGVMDATGTDPTQLPRLPLHRQIPPPNEEAIPTTRVSSIPPISYRNGRNLASSGSKRKISRSRLNSIKYWAMSYDVMSVQKLVGYVKRCPRCGREFKALSARHAAYLLGMHEVGTQCEGRVRSKQKPKSGKLALKESLTPGGVFSNANP